ncbi:MAG TPA: hypothetical protein PLD88_07235, partial [Candidatus Berkiella sp.]|nr:hypothetical protein [Candidatus Berkiella sp.]
RFEEYFRSTGHDSGYLAIPIEKIPTYKSNVPYKKKPIALSTMFDNVNDENIPLKSILEDSPSTNERDSKKRKKPSK